jgi:hypothetical protein
MPKLTYDVLPRFGCLCRRHRARAPSLLPCRKSQNKLDPIVVTRCCRCGQDNSNDNINKHLSQARRASSGRPIRLIDTKDAAELETG